MAGGSPSPRHYPLSTRIGGILDAALVLSSDTEQYDRGLKWESSQRIESLTDYLLVSQGEPRVEHFGRDRGGTWIYRAA